ncbi:MAG TPA: hypothetical protein VHO07_30720 [Streptosporangiaceae bacterium]|nr:hypothetical protein [Streptosporangiaceae bacterium]
MLVYSERQAAWHAAFRSGTKRPTSPSRHSPAVRLVFSSMTNIGQHVNDTLEVVRQLQAEQPA